MKALLFTISFVGMATSYLFAQTYTGEKLSISQILIKQETEWNKGHIEGFMASYWKSDSLEFVGKKGLTKGWKNTLNMYKKSYPNSAAMGMLNFEIIKIDVLTNDAAYVVGRWQLTRDKDKGNLGGYFTLLFKKIDGEWVIVSDHSS
ncbi:MAG: nuclear transport factor 2 family protein [Bacteroidota bacterium]